MSAIYLAAFLTFTLLWSAFLVGFGGMFRWLWRRGRGDDPRFPRLRL